MAYDAKVTVVANGSFAREGMDMDVFLTSDQVKALYDKWDSDKWGDIEVLNGGVLSINTEMVKKVPFDELRKVYGARNAVIFHDVANNR